jgi:hypothetical protein
MLSGTLSTQTLNFAHNSRQNCGRNGDEKTYTCMYNTHVPKILSRRVAGFFMAHDKNPGKM